MRKYLLAGVAAVAIGGFAFAPLAAHADTISIGFSLGNPSSGPTFIPVNGVAATNSPTHYSNPNLGGFNVSATVQGTPPLSEPQLDSNTIDLTSTGSGTANLFIAEQDITGPLGPFNMLSSFTSNVFHGGITSVTESTYVDAANGQFAMTTPLSSHTFMGIGSVADIAVTPDFTGLYSITEVYSVAFSGAGNINATIDTDSVPEPGSLALLGTALVGFGLIGWTIKKRRAA